MGYEDRAGRMYTDQDMHVGAKEKSKKHQVCSSNRNGDDSERHAYGRMKFQYIYWDHWDFGLSSAIPSNM